ncbi:MAG: hypothetical protein K5637_01755 [Lachnospiraceae bacterium]|nr:hypothetical protein [Lachnospiraceae bacterium]
MTKEDKIHWLEEAPHEELLRQLISLESGNSYGCNDEDIQLTKAEILKRMYSYS